MTCASEPFAVDWFGFLGVGNVNDVYLRTTWRLREKTF
jgi:hypothetical protein